MDSDGKQPIKQTWIFLNLNPYFKILLAYALINKAIMKLFNSIKYKSKKPHHDAVFHFMMGIDS